MPELPEVETVRRTLAAEALGLRVLAVRLRRRDVVSGPNKPRDLLLGGVVDRVLRHGKQLAIVTDDGRAIAVHLGMTGQLLVLDAGARATKTDHIHAEWRLGDPSSDAASPARRLLFRDPRRFGGIATFPTLAALQEARWAPLGPDALTIDASALAGRLSRTTRAVKAALLDQAVLAGVGNIYADEACFRAGVHPATPSNRLKAETIERLASAIREVLAEAIESGGSTLRDYADAKGRAGGFQTRHAVYGRADQPCPRCGRPLSGFLLAQRSTVACVRCQRL